MKPHLWLIAFIGLIVPRRLRTDWRQEWEAELRYRERLLAEWDRLDWRNKLELLRRSQSAFWDALWLQQLRWEDEMIQDIRYGVRMLLKHRGFTGVAILTLALGIGANTAIFSFINTVLLHPIAVVQPEQLARVYTGGSHASFLDYRDLAEGNQVFSGLAAHAISQLNLGRGESMSRVHAEIVTGNYFTTLGVGAASGRTFGTETDGALGAHPVAVLSHGLWQRRFNADANMVGQTIVLNGQQFTVIGIMPQGFRGTWPLVLAPEVWIPVSMQPQLQPGANLLGDRNRAWLEIFGRLKPEISMAQAQSEMLLQARQLAQSYTEQNRGLDRTEVFPLETIRGASFLKAINVFMGLLAVIVGLVLLIACANIANLLLARASLRQQEMAVRLALGATRWRLIRQLLTESILLALAGGAAGCLLAVWLMGLVRSFRPPALLPVTIEINLSLDTRVLVFTLAISVLAGVLFGLAPAWHSSKLAIIPLLKEGGAIGGRVTRFTLRNILVTAQVAVSLLLLICAGLFLRSLGQAENLDPKFETERILTVPLDLSPGGEYTEERVRTFYGQLLDQVEGVPGVQSASLAEIIPLQLHRKEYRVAVEGFEAPDGNYPDIDENTVGPRYFETMGIQLIAGREFTRQDNASSPPVVIVNQTMARLFWPGQSPLGKRLRFPLGNNTFSPYHEVVGLVKDSKYSRPGEEPKSFFYRPTLQEHQSRMVLHVRTAGEPNQLRSALRESILQLDRSLLVEVATMRENLEVGLLPARVAATLLGLLGLLGLTLSVVGIFGVISYAVSQRTSEIGLRMALGGRPLDILRLVIGQGMKLTLIGIGLGIAAALALTRFLASLLIGVSPVDPLTFVTLALLFSLVALVACYLPARRAAKVDPMIALRHE